MFEVEDFTFADAGKVGPWTKADSAGRVSEKPVSGQGVRTTGVAAYGEIVWA